MDRYLFIKGKSTADFNDEEIRVIEQLGRELTNGTLLQSRLSEEFFKRTSREFSNKVLCGWLERIKKWEDREKDKVRNERKESLNESVCSGISSCSSYSIDGCRTKFKWTNEHTLWIDNHIQLLRDKPEKYSVLVEEFNKQFGSSITNNQMRNWFHNRKRSSNINQSNVRESQNSSFGNDLSVNLSNTSSGRNAKFKWTDEMDGFLKENLHLVSDVASQRYDLLLETFNKTFKDSTVTKKQLTDHLYKKNIFSLKKRIVHSEYNLSLMVEDRRKRLREDNNALVSEWRVNGQNINPYYDIDWVGFMNNQTNITIDTNLESFLEEMNLECGEIRGDGLCFIYCLQWFMAEAFDLRTDLRMFKDRLLAHILYDDLIQDIVRSEGEDTGSMTDSQCENRAKDIVNDFFVRRRFNTNTSDVIINLIPKWFNINVVIVQPIRNRLEVKWNRVDEVFDIGIPSYNGLFMAVLRTGNVGDAHYTFLLNKNKRQKYVFDLTTCVINSRNSEIAISRSDDVAEKDCNEDDDGNGDENGDEDPIEEEDNEVDDVETDEGDEESERSALEDSRINDASVNDGEADNYHYRRIRTTVGTIAWYINKARQFNCQPLFNSLCYSCGMLLYGRANHTQKQVASDYYDQDLFNENPDAIPVFRKYRHAFPSNKMLFDKDGGMYSCKQCKIVENGDQVRSMFDVGNPVNDSYELPNELKALEDYKAMKYVSICNLDCMLLPARSNNQVARAQGISDVNNKSLEELRGMLSAILQAKQPAEVVSWRPRLTSDVVRNAVRWLCENNPIYRRLTNVDTVMNTDLLPDKQALPHVDVDGQDMGKERTGLMLLADINDLDIPYVQAREHNIGQYVVKSLNDGELEKLVNLRHYDEELEVKVWPLMFPYGRGNFVKKNPVMKPHGYKLMRFMNYDERWRRNNEYNFFYYDLYIRSTCMYNAKQIRVNSGTRLTVRQAIEVTKDRSGPYSRYKFFGEEIPRSLTGSRTYWYCKYLDLSAMTDKFGVPTFFITFTQNDSWPELVRVMRYGPDSGNREVKNNNVNISSYALEACVAFQKRFRMVMEELLKPNGGPLGVVKEWWYRREYQNRGSVHIHMVVWVVRETIPENAVVAEMPRFENCNAQSAEELEECRNCIRNVMEHNCQRTGRCLKDGRCKYGYPFRRTTDGDNNQRGQYGQYQRRQDEDSRIVPHNLKLNILWGGHLNVLVIHAGNWKIYLTKYISKGEPTVQRVLVDKAQMTERHFATRIVSAMEAFDSHLEYPLSEGSREVIYLPTDLTDASKILLGLRQLWNKDKTSTDVFCMSKIEKYLHRCRSLSNVSYGEYFTLYKYSNSKKSDVFVDRKGRKYKKRENEAIVRYSKYDPSVPHEKEKYFSQLLLCTVNLTIEDFNEQTGMFRFFDTNAEGTFERECQLRNIDEKLCPSYKPTADVANEGTTETTLDTNTTLSEIIFEPPYVSTQNESEFSSLEIRNEEDEMIDLIIEQLVQEQTERLRLTSELEALVHGFSESQRAAYNWVVNEYETKNVVQCIITGAAGSGKSYLLKALKLYFICKQMMVELMAPSGCAATIIGGTTIHYAFNIRNKNKKLIISIDQNSEKWLDFEHLSVFFIDEFSMMEHDVLHKTNDFMQHRHGNKEIFGNKSLILFGDPGQLPPVGKDIYDHYIFNALPVLLLEENMRQSLYPEFQQLLLRIRKYETTDSDIEYLRKKVINGPFDVSANDVNETTVLLPLREEKSRYNERFLLELPSRTRQVYTCIDTDSSGQVVRRRGNHDYPAILDLKIGAKVVLLKNYNVPNGWANGTMAYVSAMTNTTITIQHHKELFKTLEVSVDKKAFKYANPPMYRRQFPLELTYASTVHKAQGQSLEKVFIKLSKDFFAFGQTYVAIGRVKNPDNLFFLELDEKAFEKPEMFDRYISVINALEQRNILKKT